MGRACQPVMLGSMMLTCNMHQQAALHQQQHLGRNLCQGIHAQDHSTLLCGISLAVHTLRSNTRPINNWP